MRESSATAPAPSASTRRADYDYDLPPELIAQLPSNARDAARLLVLGRTGQALQHTVVRALPEFLRAGDLLVFNDARVRPARLHCRTASGGAVEILLVAARAGQRWQCLGRPAKRLRAETVLALPGGGTALVRGRIAAGRYEVEFAPEVDVAAVLARHGELPLPPYIKRPDGPLALDRERYQTVFAAHEGAVAAPTAGLHFTSALLAGLAAAGVRLAYVTLVVGPGTFLPVRDDDVRAHRMEPEWAELPAATVDAIAQTKAAGGRVIAVGTTTTRLLESAALVGAPGRPLQALRAVAGRGGDGLGGFWADAFILPGFAFRVIDGLLTNFHLPCSTLLMLVSAFVGREPILAAYAEAVRARYRFYSYGDAMLIC